MINWQKNHKIAAALENKFLKILQIRFFLVQILDIDDEFNDNKLNESIDEEKLIIINNN